ncbi:MAG: hypothetical protein V7L04_09885 [Nostoc sp.]|uniref:hypothetical protein n=1 Tax=unclassified Nostoc TaxID=2593658 RepID=UPI00260F006F|nr:hypothetical protein [Nostoc sp. S13]MDF5736475.1 hypothetical protein [Nostoc sp. S13]
MTAMNYTLNQKLELRVGERLRIKVREPNGHTSAQADQPGNYTPIDYVGQIEQVDYENITVKIKVRWHLPKSFGYDTYNGTTSTLIHIANGVWLETRKKPRNVVATIERITEEEFITMVDQAANK